jgi:hypothetical protein
MYLPDFAYHLPLRGVWLQARRGGGAEEQRNQGHKGSTKRNVLQSVVPIPIQKREIILL